MEPLTVSLDGKWDFTYEGKGIKDNPKLPNSWNSIVSLNVPGYWDDQIENFRDASWWDKAIFSRHQPIRFPVEIEDDLHVDLPDASLPCLIGVGWYRRFFNLPKEWEKRMVFLTVGGVVLESWIWLNRHLVGYHLGHNTPFTLVLDSRFLRVGENELIIAVANTRTDIGGSRLRGYMGKSAGIYRSVNLHISGRGRIRDLFVYSENCTGGINCSADFEAMAGELPLPPTELAWSIKKVGASKVLLQGNVPIRKFGAGETERKVDWKFQADVLKPWSPENPVLYDFKVIWKTNNNVIDICSTRYGMRSLRRKEKKIFMNGYPIFLRGATEHCYFPISCTPPKSIEYYRTVLRRMKKIGFNFLRFHTWVPPEEYLQAADEIGMLFQIELPPGLGENEWGDIVKHCRTHPCAVIYCGGNEELCNQGKIKFFARLKKIAKGLDPKCLFMPQEAMRGIEYVWNESDWGADKKHMSREPFLHHSKRLRQITSCADVFGQYSWGYLSYLSIQADWRELERKYVAYKRPILSHEIGIFDSYLNFQLENRYNGTRIGTDLYASARKCLEDAGLFDKAQIYYQNSCRWQSMMRKHVLEQARMCSSLCGYDYLGAVDVHWHRKGYGCGFLNEFYELKHSNTVKEFKKFNGESVILLDHGDKRSARSGELFSHDVMLSLYGSKPLGKGTLCWSLEDKGKSLLSGEKEILNVPLGTVSRLTTISFRWPLFDNARMLTLKLKILSHKLNLENDWNFWVFPSCEKPIQKDAISDTVISGLLTHQRRKAGSFSKCCGSKLKVVAEIEDKTVNHLQKGGDVLLLGHNPFPARQTSFQINCAGRASGNVATVIYDHPIFANFPHEGFCDWQFYRLLKDGFAIDFTNLDIPFRPILEIVGSYKKVLKQAALFEVGVGNGKLFVASLGFLPEDPVGNYLLDEILKYVSGKEFKPGINISSKLLKDLLAIKPKEVMLGLTDMAFDERTLT